MSVYPYITIKIPKSPLTEELDALIKKRIYQSRAEYFKERIREDMKERHRTEQDE